MPDNKNGDIMTWNLILYGEKETPFENGEFELGVKFSRDFPLHPPKVYFETPIWHANVNEKGKICLSRLMNEWDPNVQMIDVLEDVIQLLDYPDKVDMYDALNFDAALQLATDKEGYFKRAREYTLKFAIKGNNKPAMGPKDIPKVPKHSDVSNISQDSINTLDSPKSKQDDEKSDVQDTQDLQNVENVEDDEPAPPPPLGAMQRLITDPAQQEQMAAMNAKYNDKDSDEKSKDLNNNNNNNGKLFNFGNSKEGKAAQYVVKNSKEGDIKSMLKAFESYNLENGSLMHHLGSERGKILDDNIIKYTPMKILKLGVYLGYSTIRIANQIMTFYEDSTRDNVQFISVGLNKNYINIANEICKHGKCDSRVKILHGKLENISKEITDVLKIKSFDLIFMDHRPQNYYDDLMYLENNGFINKGAVIIADNVNNAWSDTRKFQRHVKTSEKYKSKHFRNKDNTDGIEVSVCVK